MIRAKNFHALKEKLLTFAGISHVLDSKSPDCNNSYYCLVVVLDAKWVSYRNEILQQLKSLNIGCSVYYPQPVPRMKYYAEKYQTDLSEFQNATMISDGSIALPVGPHLTTADMLYIAEVLEEVLAKFHV